MPRYTLTIAGRVIRQLIRDRRTIALIIIVPMVVMTLIGLSFPEGMVLDRIAPALLATMVLFFSFLLIRYFWIKLFDINGKNFYIRNILAQVNSSCCCD